MATSPPICKKAGMDILLVGGLLLAGTSALVRLGASDQGTQPTNQTARRAYDLLAEGFGPGFNGPLRLMHSAGGLVSVEAARALPIRLLESGPAGGALAARNTGLKYST